MMSVRLQFNERKATQAAAHMLRLCGGRMSYMKLIKLLYLADRAALLRWGRPITTDRYVSMDRGPVLSRVLDLATDGGDPGTPSIWASTITEPSNYEVQLREGAGDDELSDAEAELLDNVFAEYGKLSRWDLVKLTHQLPEWLRKYRLDLRLRHLRRGKSRRLTRPTPTPGWCSRALCLHVH